MRTAMSVRVASPLAPLVMALVLLAGCGDSSSDDSSADDGSGSTVADVAADESDFVGLDKDEAIELAESEGRTWRIGREDDEMFAVTNDFVADRVTFEIDDGVVTTATFG